MGHGGDHNFHNHGFSVSKVTYTNPCIVDVFHFNQHIQSSMIRLSKRLRPTILPRSSVGFPGPSFGVAQKDGLEQNHPRKSASSHMVSLNGDEFH